MKKLPARPGDLIMQVEGYSQWLRHYPEEPIDDSNRPLIRHGDIGLIIAIHDTERALVLLKSGMGWLNLLGSDVINRQEES